MYFALSLCNEHVQTMLETVLNLNETDKRLIFLCLSTTSFHRVSSFVYICLRILCYRCLTTLMVSCHSHLFVQFTYFRTIVGLHLCFVPTTSTNSMKKTEIKQIEMDISTSLSSVVDVASTVIIHYRSQVVVKK